jgi:DNA mismatch repair protein MSH4
MTLLDRRYWSETTGLEYIQQLAFAQDVETIKTAVTGNYFAVCCFAAVMKFTELAKSQTFPFHSLRVKYEPSEGSMMIDLATIKSLELVQNLQNAKSKDCLFGLMNETLTPMGARLLRSNILQPITSPETLTKRFEAVEELSTKEEMFFAVRSTMKPFLDADKTLTQLILLPIQASLKVTEQSINNVIALKQFVGLVKPVFEALTGSRSDMLISIRSICDYENVEPVQDLIDRTINEGTAYAKQPLDFRNQRTYAVKSGVNGLIDVARQTYKEAMTDALQHIAEIGDEHSLPLQTKFDNVRQFYLRLRAEELEDRVLPPIFINVYRKKDMIECQTLDLIKLNQKIGDAHMEVLLMSDKAVKCLIEDVREHMSSLFRICESVAMLDMLTAFAHAVSSQDYVRPVLSDTLAIRSGRHPIREKIHSTKYIPNDVYATQQTRFQIITGCNMSGKSTYIRSVALMAIMAQVGSFVPASYAAFPIMRQLFARISLDDNIEANVSSFAAEMRETAFIMHNISRDSMVIIDELGRGTSTRDGLAIALAIAEALVESRALIWFATHFRDLSRIMAERNGVINLHLAVDMSGQDRMEMLYQVAEGTVQERHYGLKLARVVPLPPDVIPHAETVAFTLERQVQRKQRRSLGIVVARRKKLLLNLKEHLIQARDGGMDDETMKGWLKDLQREFVVRMTALDEEAKAIQSGELDDDEEEDEPTAEGDAHDAIAAAPTEDTATETALSTRDDSVSHLTEDMESHRYPTPAMLTDVNGVEIVDATEMEDSRSVRTTGGSTSRQITTATA